MTSLTEPQTLHGLTEPQTLHASLEPQTLHASLGSPELYGATGRSSDPFPMLAELPLPELGDDPALDRELDHLRGQAFQEGRRAGFDQGLFEGRARAEADIRAELRAQFESWLAALDRGLDDLTRRDQELSAEMASVAVDLAMEIAGAILDREVATAVDPGREALSRALALAPVEGELVARLHPDDLESVGEIDELVAPDRITLLADASVGPGGCLIEAGAARIDARLATALERVRSALS